MYKYITTLVILFQLLFDSVYKFFRLFSLNEKVCIFVRSEAKQYHATHVGFHTSHSLGYILSGRRMLKFNPLSARFYLAIKCNHTTFFIEPLVFSNNYL